MDGIHGEEERQRGRVGWAGEGKAAKRAYESTHNKSGPSVRARKVCWQIKISLQQYPPNRTTRPINLALHHIAHTQGVSEGGPRPLPIAALSSFG